ncbi:hypothetical protein MHYMCMPSP_00696 [Hyalomma marginatum]|nr:hypothetical protein MHYMCMPSP_00696 [Hyalomma marginatum]
MNLRSPSKFLEEDFLLIGFLRWTSLLSDFIWPNRVETLHSAVTAAILIILKLIKNDSF